MLVVVAYRVGRGLDGKVRVAHRDADARGADHARVVRPVAEGDRLLRRDAERGAQRYERVALVGRGDVQLDIRRDGRADRDLREEGRELLELALSLAQIAEVHLGLLDAAAVGAQVVLQILDRRARAAEHLEDAFVGDIVPRVVEKILRDKAPVVLVAVIEHVEAVHIVHQPDGQLVSDLGAVERGIRLRVIDISAVDRDEIARKGLELQRGGNDLVDPPCRRDDQRAVIVGCLQRAQRSRRDRLVVVQERAVEIKGNQFCPHASLHSLPFS